ncbi:MAG: hypothetical protein PHW66_03775 [Gallionella sp.]|nr:hypothetical protein [Gallionella sp.]
MYETMPNSNVVYSPLPTRHYVRQGTFANTFPATQAMRSRNQAWWNLIWLACPEVDEVFKVVDEASYDAYQKVARPRVSNVYPSIRALLLDTNLVTTIILKDAVKTMQPREFMAYLETLPYMKTKYFQKDGQAKLELMRQRAELAETGKLYLLNPPKGTKAIVADKSEYEKVIQPSIDARVLWLQKAAALFGDHIRAAGFEMPKVTFEIDQFLLSRNGVCYKSTEGKPNRIGITPRFIYGHAVLHTLLHELIHAIDNNQHGHYREFVEIANKLGFKGHTMHIHPSKSLTGLFDEICQQLGPYPHFMVEFR